MAGPAKRRTRAVEWSIGVALAAVALGAGSLAGGQAPPAAATQTPAPPSPVQIANQQEQQRVMDLLKISAIPPGAVSSSPATYNEAEANPYPNLPDPLTLENGQKVTSASVWRNRRRGEILEDFQREIYGRTPKQIPKVTWRVTETTTATGGDVPTVTKQLLGRVDNSAHPASSSRSRRHW